MTLSPLNARRLHNFRANRRGWWSLWLFLGLFIASMFAELIANDRPILVYYDGGLYAPVFKAYPETEFGGFLPTEAEYKDPEVRELIESKGWIVWPLIPFKYDSINFELTVPAPAPPSTINWLGTDDQGRDVVARLIYGFRISVLFGHVFRNAMLIVIAGFPSAFIGILFTGALLTEIIFSLDGLGLLGFEAAINRDYPVMFGTLYFFTLVGLLLNLVGDLMYVAIDPRIDFERREG